LEIPRYEKIDIPRNDFTRRKPINTASDSLKAWKFPGSDFNTRFQYTPGIGFKVKGSSGFNWCGLTRTNVSSPASQQSQSNAPAHAAPVNIFTEPKNASDDKNAKRTHFSTFGTWVYAPLDELNTRLIGFELNSGDYRNHQKPIGSPFNI